MPPRALRAYTLFGIAHVRVITVTPSQALSIFPTFRFAPYFILEKDEPEVYGLPLSEIAKLIEMGFTIDPSRH